MASSKAGMLGGQRNGGLNLNLNVNCDKPVISLRSQQEPPNAKQRTLIHILGANQTSGLEAANV